MVFPFSAVVSLDKLKLAILINAINPKIGGVLIRGPKGSGKTTVVRGLTDILPKIKVVDNCSFNCNPNDPTNMCPKCSEHHSKREKLQVEEREMTIVNLPLGATEDRVVGSLDVEKAIKLGVEALEPGILAEANQNILYVDEINLLPDHIADDLLDAAASGWNVVEREGISVSHPSRFIFIGTMNPEEGELRPQLLDRFPLSTAVEKLSSVEDRITVVKRNIEFEANPEKFREKYQPAQEELEERIARARELLPKVEMPEELLETICKACLDLKVDGMRPDIVISKAASTLAAFEGRTKATLDDVLVASELALSHRTREGGFLEPAPPEEIKKAFMAAVKKVKYEDKTAPAEKEEKQSKEKSKGRGIFWNHGKATEKEEKFLENLFSKIRKQLAKLSMTMNRILGSPPIFGFSKRLRKAPKDTSVLDGVVKGQSDITGETHETELKITKERRALPTVKAALKPPDVWEGVSLLTKIRAGTLAPFKLFFKADKTRRVLRSHAGKRGETVTTLHRGRPRGWRFPHGKPRDIHLPATIRAAASRQKDRRKHFETALTVYLDDVREKLRLYKAPMTIVFVVDLSESMILNIDAVKEALLKLHRDAYRYRDRVGMVALKETGAVVVQHPITNLRVVANKLLKLRVSGSTPLAAGMFKAWEVLKEARRRDRSTIPVMVIVTDGSANIPLSRSLETGEIRDFAAWEHEDVAIRDVISLSKMIKKERIYTVVVNTNPQVFGRGTYGFAVTEAIAAFTGGTHHVVGRLTDREELMEKIVDGITEDQRLIAHKASFSTRMMD